MKKINITALVAFFSSSVYTKEVKNIVIDAIDSYIRAFNTPNPAFGFIFEDTAKYNSIYYHLLLDFGLLEDIKT